MFGQDGEPRATQREDEAGAAGVDESMEAEGAQGEQESEGERSQLEETPTVKKDKRYPIDPRAPAQKRARYP